MLRNLGGINIDRLTHGRACKPFGVVVPKRAKYWVARDFMETDDLGENAVVANRLIYLKMVCHIDTLLTPTIIQYVRPNVKHFFKKESVFIYFKSKKTVNYAINRLF